MPHSRLVYPIPTRTVRALHFYRDKASALSSLVDSRRNVATTTAVLPTLGADPFYHIIIITIIIIIKLL